MRNGFDKNAAVFSIGLLLFMVAFAPAINSSTVKSNTLYNNTITYDVYFGTTSPPPKVVSNQSETSYDPGGLEYNTTYYWQIIAWDEQGESAEGPIWHFTTETVSPCVETLNASSVGKHNATLHGKILEDGGESCKVRFRYREMGQPDWIYPSDWHGSYVTNETFSEYIDGLNLSTLYEFQAGAKNSIDEQWGETDNFTTNENQFPVAIIIAPSIGDKKVDITFDGSSSYDPDGYIVEYNWDFGDGGTGNGSIITHQFQHSGAYTVTLQVEDNDEGIAYTTHSITIINHAPVASFVADQYYIEPGETVNFDGTASYDPDGDSLTYEWKLGDGTIIGTDPIISYTFNNPGTFTIILTVTDDDPVNQMCDTVTGEIHVNSPPIADFTMDPEDPIWIGTTVEFDGSSSFDPDGYIVNWTWYFEDMGVYAYGEVVHYTFVMSGEWTVTLTVTDDFGSTDDYSEVVIVLAPLGCLDSSEESQISTIYVDTNRNVEVLLTMETSRGYPPRIPSNPYPEDGATNVPIDVVLSWTGGEDNPPETPVISGETNVKVGEEYTYCINPVVDPDGDRVWVFWDWGDGTNTSWLGPYASGEQACANHSWDKKGTCIIMARLRDDYGALSEWGYLEITIPRTKILQNTFLQWLIEKFPNAFPILRYIFGLLGS